MKRYNKRKKNKYHGFLKTVQDEIIVTNHAIKQHKLRTRKENITDEEAKRAIIQHIKQSRLLSTKKENDVKFEEIRSFYGNVYVCVREKGILRDKLVVKTMKLSQVKMKERFSRDFDMNSVDNHEMEAFTPDEARKLREVMSDKELNIVKKVVFSKDIKKTKNNLSKHEKNILKNIANSKKIHRVRELFPKKANQLKLAV